MRFSVLDRIKALRDELINRGADKDNLVLVMDETSYHKLHKVCQEIAGKEVLIIEKILGMEIVVSQVCSDDMMHILDKGYIQP